MMHKYSRELPSRVVVGEGPTPQGIGERPCDRLKPGVEADQTWAHFHFLPFCFPRGAMQVIRGDGLRVPESMGRQSLGNKSFPERVPLWTYLERAENPTLMMTLGHQTSQMWSFCEHALNLQGTQTDLSLFLLKFWAG